MILDMSSVIREEPKLEIGRTLATGYVLAKNEKVDYVDVKNKEYVHVQFSTHEPLRKPTFYTWEDMYHGDQVHEAIGVTVFNQHNIFASYSTKERAIRSLCENNKRTALSLAGVASIRGDEWVVDAVMENLKPADRDIYFSDNVKYTALMFLQSDDVFGFRDTIKLPDVYSAEDFEQYVKAFTQLDPDCVNHYWRGPSLFSYVTNHMMNALNNTIKSFDDMYFYVLINYGYYSIFDNFGGLSLTDVRDSLNSSNHGNIVLDAKAIRCIPDSIVMNLTSAEDLYKLLMRYCL